MEFIKRCIGDFYTTFYDNHDPREKGDPNACYLEIAAGELIWHADEYHLIYCAPYSSGGPKHQNGRRIAFHERVVFLAVSTVLMLTFGVWTAARALVLRSMMPRWDGRQPGHYKRSTPAERTDIVEDDPDGLEEEEAGVGGNGPEIDDGDREKNEFDDDYVYENGSRTPEGTGSDLHAV